MIEVVPPERFWDMPALLKWEARRIRPEPPPPERADGSIDIWHPYFNFLDQGENVIEEAIP